MKNKKYEKQLFPYRYDNRKYLTEYDVYVEVTDKLDMHDPNTGDDPRYAEMLELEYDEEEDKYLNPYKDGVLTI